MVYEWDQHKDVCYRLYIEERKSLEEIMQYMHDTYNFNPSKRAYQTNFKRWNFPSKQNPAHRNLDLVSRVKELWEQNYTQRDMLNTLNAEGYDIKERELMRLRAKNKWLLRVPNGVKQAQATPQEPPSLEEQLAEAVGLQPPTDSTSQEPPTEVERKRKERHDELKADSDERWASRKRRRRTRSYAGIPADPPGPPRFPSETTLDEGKQFLSLDAKLYRSVRDHFQRICEEEGIIKKTIAGDDKWNAAKSRLIQEHEHLQGVMWTGAPDLQKKQLALDVICTDVTKRMRTAGTRMTIMDAKNVLGINPEQSRQIRDAFYKILQGNYFTSKLETGNDQWQAMKEQWIANNTLLQEILNDEGQTLIEKQKALEVLCRDVMKRLRDDQTRRLQGQPGEALSATSDANEEAVPTIPNAVDTAQVAGAALGAAAEAVAYDNLQIDPSLLQPDTDFFSAEAPTAVFIRTHPQSEVHNDEKMWLASLSSRSVEELRGILALHWPDASVIRIDAIDRSPNGQTSYRIDEDDELDAYLDHVRERKAMFVVMLNRL